MKRRDQYVMFPGHCMVTGSSDTSRGVLDLELDREFDGASYLSGALVEEAAALWGFVSPEKYAELVEQNEALRKQVAALSSIIEVADGLRAAADGVQAALDEAKVAVAG